MIPVEPSSETVRAVSSASQTVAVILLAGATGFLSAPGFPVASSYNQTLINPFASASTSVAGVSYKVSESATDTINTVVSRWRRYVERRLGELSVGAHNFAGLKVPSSQVVDLARRVAQDWFYADTPTPSVLPSEDGEVMFVWHKGGWDVEIIVGLQGAEVWAYERGSGEELSGSLEELGYATSRILMRLAP